jgi:hypothetical protein
MQLQGVTEAMSKARATMSDEEFQGVASRLNNAMSDIREAMQNATAVRIGEIISKLRNEQAITPADLDLARLWIVGDAESYSRMQRDFERHMEEFTLLESILQRYERQQNQVNDLVDAHGVLEDAIHLSYEIAKFLEHKERVTNFEEAVKDPNRLDCQALADVLVRKLHSSKE